MGWTQLENFLRNHCDGSTETFIAVLDYINKGYDLDQISRMYNISPSNLSRRLNMFTCVTFKEEIWEHLRLLNDIKQKGLAREGGMIEHGSKILRFSAR